MPPPDPAPPPPDAVRRLAGACYLALATGDARHLATPPEPGVIESSGLAGMHANLCLRHGIHLDREAVMRGMQLSATNKLRWERLVRLLAALEQEGLRPILFKGGCLHARWPAMRDTRPMFDYDLIISQRQVARLREALAAEGFETVPMRSRLMQRLSKGWMVWKGQGLSYQNLDIHARVTEPPVCASLTRSILATQETANGVRIPDIEDSICMIALHIVRSGMYRPLREYIDLLWYVDMLDDSQWSAVRERARRHDLIPGLFLALRQARHCLALDALCSQTAERLGARIAELQRLIGPLHRRAIDWLAPPDYPLRPLEHRNHPLFRRSFIFWAGTSSTWRVAAAFALFGGARLIDRLSGATSDSAEQ